MLFINDEMQDFYENFFYKKWIDIEITNELINFILPLEDLDDISKIKETKNRIEDLNINDFVNKYDTKNFIFALINFQNKQLDIHLKINFEESKTSKNISYELDDINNETRLYFILKI
jgi:predicted transport protein